jgi:hypothetical protein
LGYHRQGSCADYGNQLFTATGVGDEGFTASMETTFQAIRCHSKAVIMELWEESPTWTCRQRFNPRIGSAVPSWNFPSSPETAAQR